MASGKRSRKASGAIPKDVRRKRERERLEAEVYEVVRHEEALRTLNGGASAPGAKERVREEVKSRFAPLPLVRRALERGAARVAFVPPKEP